VFKRSDDHRRILYSAFWAACAGYLIQLMFGLSVTGNTFLLWGALGIVLAPTASVSEIKAPDWGVIVAMIGVVLAGLGISYQIVHMIADNSYLVAMVASEGSGRVEMAKNAVELNPFNDMYRAEVGVANRDLMINYLNAAQQASANGQDASQYMIQAKAAYDESVASLNSAIDFVSWEYDNYVFLASVHNIAGQAFDPAYFDEAIAAAKRGIEVEQFGPAIRLELARAYESKGDRTKAIEQAKIAAEMDPGATDAWQMLASLYEQSGSLAELKRAAVAYPGHESVDAAIQRLEASSTTAPK
jgi:tetratricopeptide (TPR) repeat protein